MKKLKLIFFLLLPLISIKAQSVDDILIGDKDLPDVLLIGTFHFSYYDEDTYKTNPEDRIDILSDKRQLEIKELVEYISRFKPTKIFVEDFNKNNILMNNYREYKNGNYQLTSDEIDQIAYRLMDDFQLDTIYGVDQKTIFQTLYSNDETKDYAFDLYKGLDFERDFLDSEIGKKYMKLYEYEDQYLLENSMLDYFKWLNSPEKKNRGFYSLFAGKFGQEDERVADASTIGMVSRNFRTLNLIEKNINSANDRILILFGSSHTDFFKLYYESSPEHNLIEFNDLENYNE